MSDLNIRRKPLPNDHSLLVGFHGSEASIIYVRRIPSFISVRPFTLNLYTRMCSCGRVVVRVLRGSAHNSASISLRGSVASKVSGSTEVTVSGSAGVVVPGIGEEGATGSDSTGTEGSTSVRSHGRLVGCKAISKREVSAWHSGCSQVFHSHSGCILEER